MSFECDLLDVDFPSYSFKGFRGVIVYVRLVSGQLSPVTTNVLVPPYGDLLGRPAKGAFAPVPAQIHLPSGRHYPVVMLARLATLGAMRPHLRNAFMPPPDLDADAIPVVLGGVPAGFRATAGSLVSTQHWPHPAEPQQFTPVDLYKSEWQVRSEGLERARQLRIDIHNGKTLTMSEVAQFLDDEVEEVRNAAAAAIETLAHRLPVDPFIQAIRDLRPANYSWCLAATHVFGAHPDVVDPTVLVELYHGVQRLAEERKKFPAGLVMIRIAALKAMGHFGNRAPVDLLAQVLTEPRAIHDIRARWTAAFALGELGALAPVEALVEGMSFPQPEVAVACARALAQHPTHISDELRERARLMSDLATARRVIYQRYHSR